MNAAACLAWAKTHRLQIGIATAGAAIALGGAFWAGRASAAKPSVTETQDTAAQATSTARTETTKETGPTVTTVDETLYDPPTVNLPTSPEECHPVKLIAVPMPGPIREVRHTVIEQGPEVVRTQVVERVQEQQTQHVSLQVSQAPSPRWALGTALEDPLGSKRLQLGIGFRVIGPVWLRASFTPARGAPGMTVGGEVQF